MASGVYILPLIDGYYVAHCDNIDRMWFWDDEYVPEEVVKSFSLDTPNVAHFNTEPEAKCHAEWLADRAEVGPPTMLKASTKSMSDFKMAARELAAKRPPPEGEFKEVGPLPNGCTLFRKDNGVGGHTYGTDSIGGGVEIWDTSLVSESELLAAIIDQHKLRYEEATHRNPSA